MENTHSFQIKFNGVNIEGDFYVDDEKKMHFETEGPEAMTVEQHEDVQRLLKAFRTICIDSEDLDLIKVEKK